MIYKKREGEKTREEGGVTGRQHCGVFDIKSVRLHKSVKNKIQ